jgi:hypothetical protein
MIKILFILLIAFVSCNEGKSPEEINCKYKGAIVLEKTSIPHHFLYTIKYQGGIKTVSCYEIDFIYNVGDTINGKCL